MSTPLQLRVLVLAVFLMSAVTGQLSSVNVGLGLDLQSVAGPCLGGNTLGLTNTSVLVEYRLIQINESSPNATASVQEWRFLAEVNASQGFDQHLSLVIELPVDSHGFQLKLLQTEHGGGGCNCWRVASIVLGNCSNGSYNASGACSKEGGGTSGSLNFCLDYPPNPRGMITAAFYCSELSSDECPGGRDNLIPSKGSALPPNCSEMSPRM